MEFSPWKANPSIQGSSRRVTTAWSVRKKAGASGEIRTLKHLFLRQAAIPIRARWHMVHRGGFEPPCPTWGNRVTAGRFGLAHAPVHTWRKADESNARRSSRRSGFQGQLPTIQQYLPRCRRVRESNPLTSFENPCLADKCLTVRPTFCGFGKNFQKALVSAKRL